MLILRGQMTSEIIKVFNEYITFKDFRVHMKNTKQIPPMSSSRSTSEAVSWLGFNDFTLITLTCGDRVSDARSGLH